MLSAIGPSSYTSSAGAGTSTAGLEALLIRYQKELSDCVNCDSANTRAGRQTIQVIANKISTVKARMQEIEATTPRIQAAPNIGAGKDTGTQINATVGNRLDVFA